MPSFVKLKKQKLALKFVDYRMYDYTTSRSDRFGVSAMGLHTWKLKGVLPNPVRIGWKNYYDELELERRLVAQI